MDFIGLKEGNTVLDKITSTRLPMPVNITSMKKKNDTYILIYDDHHRNRTMMKLFTWACHPELNLEIQDAEIICDMMDERNK